MSRYVSTQPIQASVGIYAESVALFGRRVPSLPSNLGKLCRYTLMCLTCLSQWMRYTAGVATFGPRAGALGRRLFNKRCLIGATMAVTIATIASVGMICTKPPRLNPLSMPCPRIPPAIVPVLPLSEPTANQNPTTINAAARTASVRPISFIYLLLLPPRPHA